MRLRGILRKKRLPPHLQKVYDKELASAKKGIAQRKALAIKTKIQSQARRDAGLSGSSRSTRIATHATRVGKGLVRAGESFSKKMEGFNSEGFETFVTGSKPKKTSKRSTEPGGAS